MNELSLFSGAGGGLLGTKLLGFNHIGYVEWDDYCQQVIAQRIKDGYLDEAPIFTDVREFAQSGAARAYRGFVDVVSAGFPCQDISVATKDAKGMEGERSGEGWEITASVIRMVRPEFVFLENSSAILVRGFERVANDLAEMGYIFRWGVLGFADIGGTHERKRWWCVAAYPKRDRLERWYNLITERQAQGRSIQALCESKIRVDVPNPRTFREGYDVASRMDRTKAIGNGQIPAVVKTAWRTLI